MLAYLYIISYYKCFWEVYPLNMTLFPATYQRINPSQNFAINVKKERKENAVHFVDFP